MTKREFYENIINGETITNEMKEVAQSFITAMDTANEKRKSKPSKASVENQPLLDKISSEILSSELKTASDVSTVLGVSVQKASALLRTLVNQGKATSEDIKVPQKGTQKAYRLAD